MRVNYNIDEIKLFNRVLEVHEIQAGAEIFAGVKLLYLFIIKFLCIYIYTIKGSPPEDVYLACTLCTA